jgi:hypothetical protein
LLDVAVKVEADELLQRIEALESAAADVRRGGFRSSEHDDQRHRASLLERGATKASSEALNQTLVDGPRRRNRCPTTACSAHLKGE